MAKQVGPLFITGTIDGVIFYKLNGQYYMRSKGDYRSGKQMRKDPYLKRTMANADQFGVASRIVKYTYYRCLPPEVRQQGLFAKLTGMVKRWLQEGKTQEEAETLLIAYMQTLITTTTRMEMETATMPVARVTTMADSTAATTSVKPFNGKQDKRPEHCVKQARYLSHWRVKRNGRLYTPGTVTTVCQQEINPELLKE